MNFIETLKKDARSLFGKQEINIIEKQLLGIKLKPSEKTRLSRDIRKKFKSINSLSKFEDKFNLKHGQKTKEIIEDTKDLILNSSYNKKIEKIILFGSYLDGTFNLTSDIDIAVKFSNIEKKDSTKFRLEILRTAHPKVDIQVFNFLPNKIKGEIEKNGRTIYEA